MNLFKKNILIAALVCGSALSAQSFFEKQADIRAKKPLSIFAGLNSISNYYYSPFFGISYLLSSSHEIGAIFIDSKFKDASNPTYIPLQSRLLEFKESTTYDQRSVKVFYNYFLFNSIFFLNTTLGYLPSITTQVQFNSFTPIYTENSSAYDTLTTGYKKIPSYYFSPGLGLRISLDNGIFISVTGGPMILANNKTERTTSFYYNSANSDRVDNSNIFLNLPIESRQLKTGNKIEAYIDFATGISF
ncbi:hypothetical protein EHQ30_11075 [Leptospira brenneri]|uniref:Outer membrane protein beta-barrel domain-containing protein n=1 Tax=Leptospira brenneri TaxID=2023182 RepID=A0A5F1Z8C9_9LEPT|nr:hypothetical protein [Leptospira brenneri]TGK94062.1 hypothetical protein EHQ30_11075 [Leptospira brenneri]